MPCARSQARSAASCTKRWSAPQERRRTRKRAESAPLSSAESVCSQSASESRTIVSGSERKPRSQPGAGATGGRRGVVLEGQREELAEDLPVVHYGSPRDRGTTQELPIGVQREEQRAAQEGNRVANPCLRRPVHDVLRVLIEGHVALGVSPPQQQGVSELQLLLAHKRVRAVVLNHFAPALLERTHGNDGIFRSIRLFPL